MEVQQIKGLTILQPYASLIAVGAKRYETRSRATNHRGLVAIHAGKCPFHLTEWQGTPDRQTALIETFGGRMNAAGTAAEGLSSDYHNMPLGAVVAVAELVDCHKVVETHTVDRDTGLRSAYLLSRDGRGTDTAIHDQTEILIGDWAYGRYAYELANVRKLATPLPYRGQQGWWTIPPDVEAEIMRRCEQ